jgi:hypothetical protein
MRRYAVGTRVNFVKNDDPECAAALQANERCRRKLKRSYPANRTDSPISIRIALLGAIIKPR